MMTSPRFRPTDERGRARLPVQQFRTLSYVQKMRYFQSGFVQRGSMSWRDVCVLLDPAGLLG